MKRSDKEQLVIELKEKMKGATALYYTDFTGLNVKRMTDLRRRLRKANVEYVVIKNTLALIAVKDTPIDRYRALLCRHRCQSSINTVTRGRAQGLIGGPRKRADGWCVEFLVTILRGHQTCPAAGANPAARDETRNTLLVDPPKATKGRRMSKKTRKKSSKAPPGKSGRTSAAKPSAAKTARGSKASVKKPAAKKAAPKKKGK